MGATISVLRSAGRKPENKPAAEATKQAVKAVLEGKSVDAALEEGEGSGRERVGLYCQRCKEIIPSLPGYKNALWRHCPCGGVATRQASEKPSSKTESRSSRQSVGEKSNQSVIEMFLTDSFPKDKRPVWGTENLRITKTKNGWALVNYRTPLLYRANGSESVLFNAERHSVSTSKIQNEIRRTASSLGVALTEVEEDRILDSATMA